MQSGLLRLAEALSFHRDLEVVSSTVRAVIATLKSGERCSMEPEVIGKGSAWPGDPTQHRPCLECSSGLCS